MYEIVEVIVGFCVVVEIVVVMVCGGGSSLLTISMSMHFLHPAL